MMMETKTREDKFRVGDHVTFIDEDIYVGSGIPEKYRSEWGNGPYKIEAVLDNERAQSGMGHTQLVTVNGVGFSGWWFQPIRAST